MSERRLKYGGGFASLVFGAVLLLLFAAPCFGQAVSSYVFASGNTGALLTDEDARMNLGSFEQANITAVADRIACSLTHFVRVTDAVGVYPAAAENSLIVQTDLGLEQTEYLGSLLGRYAHQKFILQFLLQPAGKDRLWILKSSESWKAVAREVRRLQVTPLTVAKEAAKTVLYVVDFGSKQTAALNNLAAQLHAAAETVNGSEEMLGDEDRGKAMALYERNIQSVEAAGRGHLSAALWSRRWHDAASRTCSQK